MFIPCLFSSSNPIKLNPIVYTIRNIFLKKKKNKDIFFLKKKKKLGTEPTRQMNPIKYDFQDGTILYVH
jgi:hypothetical protein